MPETLQSHKCLSLNFCKHVSCWIKMTISSSQWHYQARHTSRVNWYTSPGRLKCWYIMLAKICQTELHRLSHFQCHLISLHFWDDLISWPRWNTRSHQGMVDKGENPRITTILLSELSSRVPSAQALPRTSNHLTNFASQTRCRERVK